MCKRSELTDRSMAAQLESIAAQFDTLSVHSTPDTSRTVLSQVIITVFI